MLHAIISYHMAVILDRVNEGVVVLPKQKIGIFSNSYFKITQFLVWPLIYILATLFFRLVVRGKENLRGLKPPFIVISNHVSVYDAFFFRLIFTHQHLPLRFMAVKTFEWKFLNFLAKLRIIDLIYSVFGVFTIVKGRGVGKNLEESKSIIRSGGNVVIYPEGRINRSGIIANFKIGATLLAQQTGVPIVPVSFKREDGSFLRKVFKINIGNSIIVKSTDNVLASTTKLQKYVEQLNQL